MKPLTLFLFATALWSQSTIIPNLVNDPGLTTSLRPLTSQTSDPAKCTPGVTPNYTNPSTHVQKFCSDTDTWTAVATGAGGGITQLTGGVTAGPGSGSQAATVAAIPLGVGVTGGAAGLLYDNSGVLAEYASGAPNSALANSSVTINGSGCLGNAGSVSLGATGTITSANCDNITTSNNWTAVAAPGTPSAGLGAVYVDSTSKNLSVKDDAGLVKHGVQTDTGTANNYISAISDAGLITKSRPTCATLSDSVATCSSLTAGTPAITAVTGLGTNVATFLGTPTLANLGAVVNGTSGGVLGYTGTSTLASSIAGVQNAIMAWGGAGATPTSPLSLLITNQNATNETWTLKNTIALGITKLVIDPGASQSTTNPLLTLSSTNTNQRLLTMAGSGNFAQVSGTSGLVFDSPILLGSSNPKFYAGSNGANFASDGGIGFTTTTPLSGSGTVDLGLCRDGVGIASIYSTNICGTTAANYRAIKASALGHAGTTFTTDTGCGTTTSRVGGASGGRFALGANGPCTVVITMGNSATGTNGWICWASDRSVLTALVDQSADTTTTASLNIPTGALSGDTISFGCDWY